MTARVAEIDEGPPYAGIPFRETQGQPVAGSAGAEHFLATAFLVLRAVQLVQASVIALTAGGYRSLPAVLSLLLVVIGWSVLLGRRLLLRRAYDRQDLALGDVLVSAVGVGVLALLCTGDGSETWTNWMYPVATSTVVGAAVALPVGRAVMGTGVITAAHLAGAGPALVRGEASTANAVGNSLSYAGFLFLVLILARQLRRTGRAIDAATGRAVAAEAINARQRERLAHYHRLHDGALATLTLIGQGMLDHRCAPVRERAARDALALRQLLENDHEHPGAACTSLAGALQELVARRQAEGTSLHYQADGLPKELPSQVLRTLIGATSEALNNAAKHAPGSAVWLTALGEPHAVRILVVDRGPGLRVDPFTARRGLVRSVREPLHQIGGSVEVHGSVGDGVTVDVRWPA